MDYGLYMKNKSKIMFLILTLIFVSFIVIFISFNRKETFDQKPNTINQNQQDNQQNDSLIVNNPKSDQLIESPLELSGQVRGTWLFEANSPVVLVDWDGLIIAEGYIEATEDWMTEDFVPFTGVLIFEKPEDIGEFSDFGFIIFNKANPSGLPENDDALEFRIRFR